MSILNPNVALIGRMGAGKSTVAQELEYRGYHRFSWAQGVRDIFSMAYDVITPENYADVKSRVYTVLEDQGPGVGPVERSGRELLQRIGTEALRDSVDQDFWIKAGIRRADSLGRPVVNDDTRFLNEAAALRELGFLIVRVTRPGFEGNGSTHPSEVEQDAISVHATIANDGTLDELRQKIADAIPAFCPQCDHPDGRGQATVHFERQGYWWCHTCNDTEMAGPCR